MYGCLLLAQGCGAGENNGPVRKKKERKKTKHKNLTFVFLRPFPKGQRKMPDRQIQETRELRSPKVNPQKANTKGKTVTCS